MQLPNNVEILTQSHGVFSFNVLKFQCSQCELNSPIINNYIPSPMVQSTTYALINVHTNSNVIASNKRAHIQ